MADLVSDPLGLVLLLSLPVAVVLVAGLAACADATLAGAGPGSVPVEVARLLVGRRRRTPSDDAVLGRGGAALLPVVAVLAAAVVPLGPRPVADLDVGVVWFNAMEVLAWVAVWTAGWGPNAAPSLVGGYRGIAQGLAYELPHMFAIITPAIAAGSLRVTDVVAAQQGLWFAAWMPVAFVLYLVSVAAMAFWGPFAGPLGRDLAGGAAAEHAGVDRLLLLAGRWMLVTVAAAFAVPLFLGGGAPLPGLGALGGPAWAWAAGKTVVVLAVLVAARHLLPTLRMTRFASFSWVVLLPLGVAQALVVSLGVIT